MSEWIYNRMTTSGLSVKGMSLESELIYLILLNHYQTMKNKNKQKLNWDLTIPYII